MFFVKKLSATCYLVEKVNKAPKERLCRKDIGMNNLAVCEFLNSILTLLKLLSNVSNMFIFHILNNS